MKCCSMVGVGVGVVCRLSSGPKKFQGFVDVLAGASQKLSHLGLSGTSILNVLTPYSKDHTIHNEKTGTTFKLSHGMACTTIKVCLFGKLQTENLHSPKGKPC